MLELCSRHVLEYTGCLFFVHVHSMCCGQVFANSGCNPGRSVYRLRDRQIFHNVRCQLTYGLSGLSGGLLLDHPGCECIGLVFGMRDGDVFTDTRWRFPVKVSAVSCWHIFRHDSSNLVFDLPALSAG